LLLNAICIENALEYVIIIKKARYGCTAVTPLAAGAPAHHVQDVHIDAWYSLWLRADISTGRHRATLDTAGKRASVQSADNMTCHGCHLWPV